MKVLLDTCALIWLVADQDQLTDAAVEVLADSATSLFISPISGFEIVLKARKGRLDLPVPPRTWLEQAVRTFGLQEAPLSLAVAADAGDVPLPHGNPADRIIVATARLQGLSVVTANQQIRECGLVPIIW